MIRKRIMKKSAAVVITGALTIAMAATVVAAPQGPGGRFGRGGNSSSSEEGDRPELPNGEKPDFEEGDRPELPNGEKPDLEEGERPEMPEGGQPQRPGENGERGRKMKGIDTDEIRTAIEALEDGEVKTDLEALLDTYEEAKSALESAMESKSEDIDSYRKAEMEAMKTLREALEEAGIDTRPELPSKDRKEQETGSEEDQDDTSEDVSDDDTVEDDPTENVFTAIFNRFRSLGR